MSRRVNVVGAGFTGLVSAYFLRKSGFDVQVFEQNSRPGGLIRTVITPAGPAELAANAILSSNEFLDLCRETGVTLQLARPQGKKRFIYRDGLRQWPLNPWATIAGFFRFLISRPKRPFENETVRNWGDRIFGSEITSWLLSPALQGIYAGDISQMSAPLIFSRFFSKARTKSGAPHRPRKPRLVAPVRGMEDFILKLSQHLTQKLGVPIHYETPFALSFDPGPSIVVATSCENAAQILKDVAPLASQALGQIEVLPLCTVSLFFPTDSAGLPGFGCLFPAQQGFRVLGILNENQIFDHRGPHRNERWIFGGHHDPRICDLTDQALLDLVGQERARLVPNPAKPIFHLIDRKPKALPHYTVRLEEILRSQAIRELESRAIYLMGNFMGTLGLSRILESARLLPDRISSGKKA